MKPEHTKPFNAEHAKAGAPYCQRNGLAVRILAYDRECQSCFRIVGLIKNHEGEEVLSSWTVLGNYSSSVGEHDLVMLPLGYCGGKPVFVGDVLDYPKAAPSKNPFYEAGAMCRDFEAEGFTWHRTAPVMPIIFHSNSAMQSTFEHIAMYNREILERHWKALDEFNGVKA